MIDNDPTLQWIINKADVGKYVFVLLELDQPTRIYKLVPLSETRRSTVYTYHYSLLSGGVERPLLLLKKSYESHTEINIFSPFTFNVTKPYKYYRFTCTGKKQFGLSEIKLYEAIHLPPQLSQIALNSHSQIFIKSLSHIKIKQTNVTVCTEYESNYVKHIVDGDPTTEWVAALNTPGGLSTIDIDLEIPKSLCKIVLSPRAKQTTKFINGFILNGSNDQTT